MEIVLFDLDHTIIDGDTDFLWGKFLVENNVVDKNYYESKNEYFFQEYQAGSLDPLEFARFSYKPLADNDYNRLLELREVFFTNKIRNIFYKDAVEIIRDNQRKNNIVCIVTSTNSFISQPTADFLEIPHLLASNPEFVDGAFTGNIDGIACFNSGKVDKVNEWMDNLSLNNVENISFYTDSHNDLPLLEFVPTPIVVNPDHKLDLISKEKRWKKLTFKELL